MLAIAALVASASAADLAIFVARDDGLVVELALPDVEPGAEATAWLPGEEGERWGLSFTVTDVQRDQLRLSQELFVLEREGDRWVRAPAEPGLPLQPEQTLSSGLTAILGLDRGGGPVDVYLHAHVGRSGVSCEHDDLEGFFEEARASALD